MADEPASFVWYELMTSDMDAAETFYRSVIGWDAENASPGDMRYTIATAGDKRVAGLMNLPREAVDAGAKPGWIGYISVPDIDAAAAKLTAAGGTVHKAPTDIPGIGQFAMVADPQGAAFVLFQPQGEPQEAVPPMTVGHVGWHELHASDWKSALAFYSGQFGWSEAEAMDMGEMGTYLIFSAAGPPIGGMISSTEGSPRPYWLYYFTVDAIDAAIERIKAGGGTILHGPHEVPGGAWIVNAMDPQGAMFALVASSR